MSNHTTSRKIRLGIAAIIAAAGIGVVTASAVSASSAPVHSVHQTSVGPWPAPTPSANQG